MSQSDFLKEIEGRLEDWRSADDPSLPLPGCHTTRSLSAQKWIDGHDGFNALARLVRIVKRLREIGGRLAEDLRENDPGLMDWRAALEYDGQDEGVLR